MANTETKALTLPCVHLNGTSREALKNQYRTAYNALRDAETALLETGPNGRDYYPLGPNAINTAMAEHWDRLTRVQTVLEELATLSMHVEG